MNYILIDYENVRPDILPALGQTQCTVIVFVGERQNKVEVDTAIALQVLGKNAEYVKISGSGPNALDFYIAFYIGQLSEREFDSSFQIISKDKGFDPLIRHLKSKGINATQSASIIPPKRAGTKTQATNSAVSNTTSVEIAKDKFAQIVTNLQRRGKAKPRTLTTLANTINVLFHEQTTKEEIDGLIEELAAKGVLKIDGTKVSYPTLS